MRPERRVTLERDFPTEADLCDAYMGQMADAGWLPYPETAGFDILLVRVATGHQLGVHAKLKLNADVIGQILPHPGYHGMGFDDTGPDWRAVLVRDPPHGGLVTLLRIAGIMVTSPEWTWDPARFPERKFCHYGWAFKHEADRYELAWHDWNPKKRCTLPELVPSVRAGVPAPIQLTPWKIGALKVCAILEVQGWIDRKAIRNCGCDPRRWCDAGGWLRRGDEDGRWVRGPNMPKFEKQHPKEFAALVAKERTKVVHDEADP